MNKPIYERYYEPETEKDASLTRINMVNMLTPSRLMKEVDRELKYWGYTYYSEVLAEIKRSSGINAVMGKLLKQNMKPDTVNAPAPIFTGTTERFENINSAVSRMPLDAKIFTHCHYVINEDRKDFRNDQSVSDYAKRVGINLRTYNRHLKECKQITVGLDIFGIPVDSVS